MTDRTTARWVGVLFIVATAAAIVGGGLVESVVADAPGVSASDEIQMVPSSASPRCCSPCCVGAARGSRSATSGPG
jgi:hypothetical protein